ncbi:hypothetical protein CLOM_g15630 [Closterium sp. NIES-68]|nr:hypothetical protein CLOM_g15630 [Closterium sp. NIES-68]GJP83280.1 hypothetical protein CLOP_g13453 [Closterium sp. NIES-67]
MARAPGAMLLAATTTCLLLLLLLGSASAKGNGHAFRPVPLSSRVQFPNFQSTDLLHLFGSASSYHRKAVRLTSAEHSAGALILRTPVVLLDRPGNSANSSACRALAWSSVFSFRVSGPADGFAMVLWQRLRNLGSADGYLGYGGGVRYRRSRALAIEFDTYHNVWDPKPSFSASGADGGSRGGMVSSHVGINFRNSVKSLAAQMLVAPLNDTKIRRAWVIYDGRDLAVYVGRGRTRPRRAVMRGRMNLCAVLKKPGFFVGFTASSAASPAVHDILSWTFAVAPAAAQQCPTCLSTTASKTAVACCSPFRCCNGFCLAPTELCGGSKCCGSPANGRVCWANRCCSVTSICMTKEKNAVCCNQVGNSTCCL